MAGKTGTTPNPGARDASMTSAQLDAFINGLSDEQKAALASMSADDKRALAKTLQQTGPRKRTPLDVTDAESVTFIADLEDAESVTDKRFLGERMLWSNGLNNAKGPKGGVYYAGVVSLGFKDDKHAGAMKISKQSFDALRAGGTAKAWVRLKGADKDCLIGVMTNYRPVAQRAAAGSKVEKTEKAEKGETTTV